MLTEIKVRNAQPGRYSDGRGDGLMLLVRPSGGRFWVQRLRIDGKTREMGHGSFPAVSLAEARRRAAAARDALSGGRDPISDRAAVTTGVTLRDAVDAYVAAHSPGWRGKKTARQFVSSLEQSAAALLAMPPAAITVADVHSVLAPIWTSKPVLAQKVRSRLEHSLEFAVASGWRAPGTNPATWKGNLRPLLARPSKVVRNRHQPSLPWQRVPAFLGALRGEETLSARALELALFTAVRSGEARHLEWSELDLLAGVWNLPGPKTKSGRPLTIPLVPSLVRMLETLPRTSTFVFPNVNERPYSDNALLALIRRMDARSTKGGGAGWRDPEGQRITPHGFRSSFRDWAGDTAQPVEVAEACLSHVTARGDATARAYARSTMYERRKTLLTEWAVFLTGSP